MNRWDWTSCVSAIDSSVSAAMKNRKKSTRSWRVDRVDRSRAVERGAQQRLGRRVGSRGLLERQASPDDALAEVQHRGVERARSWWGSSTARGGAGTPASVATARTLAAPETVAGGDAEQAPR